MNTFIDESLLAKVDLKQPVSFLLVYLCHELSHNDTYYKNIINIDDIIDHFEFIFKNSTYTETYVNNILHILVRKLTDQMICPDIITNYDVHKMIDIYTLLLECNDLCPIIIKSPLLENNLDKLILYTHSYFKNKITSCEYIFDRLGDLFLHIGMNYIKNYLFIKVKIYNNIELNNVKLTTIITNDYKIMILCTYILSNYVIKHNISYNDTPFPFCTVLNTPIPKINISSKHNIDYLLDDTNTSQYTGDDAYNDVMIYKFLFKILDLTMIPLYTKIAQLRDDITLVTRSINDISDRYTYRNIYNHLFINSLETYKLEHEDKYNSFYDLINNKDYIFKIVLILNNLYKNILVNDITLEAYIIQFSVYFCKYVCNNHIQASNIESFKYIFLGFLNILNNNTQAINIYMKCLIVDILCFNKHHIIHLFDESDHRDVWHEHLLSSIMKIYSYIELIKTYDRGEKLLLRNNIHIILNYFITTIRQDNPFALSNKETIINIPISYDKHYFDSVEVSNMMFLLFQDLNVFFEYIVYFIKYKVQITTHIHNYTPPLMLDHMAAPTSVLPLFILIHDTICTLCKLHVCVWFVSK